MWILFGLVLVLACVGDGLPKSLGERGSQLALLPFTTAFLAGFTLLISDRNAHWLQRLPAWTWRHSLYASIVMLAGTLVSLFMENSHFARFGYHLSASAAIGLCVAGAGLCLALTRVGDRIGPRALLACILTVFGLLQILSIRSFPLIEWRSDMLPLVVAADHSLLSAHDPYHPYHLLGEVIYLTYLPGTLLAFLPAVASAIDPRWINVICLLGLAIIAFQAAAISYRREVIAAMAVLLFSPYLQVRHELYTAPQWLLMTSAAALLAYGRRRWAAAVFGLGVATSQFFWILVPLLLLFYWEEGGLRELTEGSLILAGTALIILAPFYVFSPHAMIYGVLSHWQKIVVDARPINLSYWISLVLPGAALSLIQGAVLAAIYIYCFAAHGCRDVSSCLRWMSVALLALIVLNVLVWGYFYLLLLFLLFAYVAVGNGWWNREVRQ